MTPRVHVIAGVAVATVLAVGAFIAAHEPRPVPTRAPSYPVGDVCNDHPSLPQC